MTLARPCFEKDDGRVWRSGLAESPKDEETAAAANPVRRASIIHGGARSGAGPDSRADVLQVKSPEQGEFKTTIAPLLAKYCTNCHGGDSPKNDLSLEFADDRSVEQRLLKDRKLFERMAERIRLGEMPPGQRIKPNEAEKNLLFTWIDRDVLQINPTGPARIPGPVAVVRRYVSPESSTPTRFAIFSISRSSSPPTIFRQTTSAMVLTTLPICCRFRRISWSSI